MKKSLTLLCFLLYLTSRTLGAPNESPKTETIDESHEETNCGEFGDCPSSPLNCHEKCGCDRFAVYYYNETTGKCVLSYKHLMIPKVNIYVEYEPFEDENEHVLSRGIRVEADKIFKAILISVVFFISCCGVCVVLACLYCCRMNYTDYRLKCDVKALSKKLNSNRTIKKGPKKRTAPAEESCNIVCEDAGVFVV